MISAARAQTLRRLLDPFVEGFDALRRVEDDPVEAPRRYRDPADQEIAGLIASCFAYGRVELFKPKVMRLLDQMGPSPAAFVRRFEPGRDGAELGWFAYRFHKAGDLGALLAGAGAALQREGSLGAMLARQVEEAGSLQGGLTAFTHVLREEGADRAAGPMGAPAALGHLLPDPSKGGASKRLLLYLRWMVRKDAVDLGTWEGLLPRDLLLMPLDTHVMRVSLLLGLTRRKDASWRTAEEITASLRRLDPVDPLRYDFPLCHLGMSGLCPTRRDRARCLACPLRTACNVGRRLRVPQAASD